MGYRLSINHNNNEIYYGTKYYGYAAGGELVDIIHHGSKSCKYLLDKGYVDDKTFWWYTNNEIKYLAKSYRTTIEIMDFANKILKHLMILLKTYYYKTEVLGDIYISGV